MVSVYLCVHFIPWEIIPLPPSTLLLLLAELPGPPATVTVVSSQEHATMTVEWTPPAISQQHPVLQYSVSCARLSSWMSPALRFIFADNKTLSTSYSEFSSYCLYDCCVAAINVAGTGRRTCKRVTSPEYREFIIITCIIN